MSERAQQASSEQVDSSYRLLDQIVEEGRLARDPAARERGKNLVKEFVSQVLEGTMTVSKDAEAMINTRIAQIDHLVSIQLNEILHNPAFQKLESTWRGLRFLVDQTETGPMLKISALNVSKRELLRDMQRAPEFDQSTLFKKVNEEAYSVFGGAPFAALIGDYEFGKGPEDIELLEKTAQVAAVAHTPFLSAVSPDLFDLPSYTALYALRDLASAFHTTEYARWNAFRQSENSRYVALCLPRMLGRLPYGRDTSPIEGFDYEEFVDAADHSKHLWINSAFALASRINESFVRFGWPVAIRGVEGGGLVGGLPVCNFYSDEGDVVMRSPTEVPITDSREREMADLGFVPLVHCKGTDYAAFFSVPSAQKPKEYETEAANANSRLAGQLPYVLAVSRFAHYLKAMIRDRIGSTMSGAECERFLNDWIQRYVAPEGRPQLSALQDAKRPAVRQEVNGRHREAMDHLEMALLAKAENRLEQFEEGLRLAYENERKAADAISPYDIEPTRSVLHRSAATLALQNGWPAEAELLVHRGLQGRCPKRIAEEFLQLLQQLPASDRREAAFDQRDGARSSEAARYPLKSASISVWETPGKPGARSAVAFLQPRFHLDDLTVALRVPIDLGIGFST